MKKTFFLSLGLALATPILSWADLTIVQNIDGQGQMGAMTLKSKGTKIRVDVGDQVSTLMDVTSGEMTTIMHANKAFMKVDASVLKMLEAQANQGGKPKATGELELKATGQKETVGEYQTEIYTSEDGGTKAKYWIVKDYPKGEKLMEMLKAIQESPIGKMAESMARQPKNYPGVPVKSEVELATGQKVTTTLVSINDDNIDAALFAVPSDYKALAAPAIPAP